MLAHPNANSSSSTLSDVTVPSSSSSSTTRSILRSSPSTLNIQFAPLPDIPQRKRRSSAPLGVAHRASMMRRQQMRREGHGGSSWDDNQNQNYQPNSRTYVNGDGSSVTVNYESGKRSGQQDEDEDPLIILGRLVKDATKQLWRKVSTPSIPATPVPEPSEKVQQQPPPSSDVVIASKSQEELDRSDDTTSGGGVWDDQVEERFILAAARQPDVDPPPKIDNTSTSPADNNRQVPFPSPSPDRIDTQMPLDSSLMEQTASLDITDKDEFQDALPSPSSSHTARQHPTRHSPPPLSPSPTSPTSPRFPVSSPTTSPALNTTAAPSV